MADNSASMVKSPTSDLGVVPRLPKYVRHVESDYGLAFIT